MAFNSGFQPKRFKPRYGGGGQVIWRDVEDQLPREIIGKIMAGLHQNIIASMCPSTVLTPQMGLSFAHRTLAYRRACFALEEGQDMGPRQSRE